MSEAVELTRKQINCALETDGVSDGRKALHVCCFYHGFLEIQSGGRSLPVMKSLSSCMSSMCDV
jgi:hypothetical protein